MKERGNIDCCLYNLVPLLVDCTVRKGQRKGEYDGICKEQIHSSLLSPPKHYSATSEVSLFLSVLINRVMKD